MSFKTKNQFNNLGPFDGESLFRDEELNKILSDVSDVIDNTVHLRNQITTDRPRGVIVAGVDIPNHTNLQNIGTGTETQVLRGGSATQNPSWQNVKGGNSLRCDLGLGIETSALSVAHGGTGSGSARGARDNLEILNSVYPVGAIFLSVNHTNPAALLGGTWQRWGQGRVPVGVEEEDNLFRQAGNTGGSATAVLVTHTHVVEGAGGHGHTTTSGEGEHTHTTVPANTAHHHGMAHTHAVEGQSGVGTSRTAFNRGTGSSIRDGNTEGSNRVNTESAGANHTHAIHSSGAHSHSVNEVSGHTHTVNTPVDAINVDNIANLQPYITCFMWQRTA